MYLQSIIDFSSSQQHVATTLPRPTWPPQACHPVSSSVLPQLPLHPLRDFDSDSFQHKNAITFGKRRQQEKHSWCVINAWRKTQVENIWHRGLGQTAASWQIWVTFSDPYKVLEGILSAWIHSHSLLNREGMKTFFRTKF